MTETLQELTESVLQNPAVRRHRLRNSVRRYRLRNSVRRHHPRNSVRRHRLRNSSLKTTLPGTVQTVPCSRKDKSAKVQRKCADEKARASHTHLYIRTPHTHALPSKDYLSTIQTRVCSAGDVHAVIVKLWIKKNNNSRWSKVSFSSFSIYGSMFAVRLINCIQKL